MVLKNLMIILLVKGSAQLVYRDGKLLLAAAHKVLLNQAFGFQTVYDLRKIASGDAPWALSTSSSAP